MVIDIHWHHTSPELIAEAKRNGPKYTVEVREEAGGAERLVFDNGVTTRPFFPEMTDLDVRLRDMDQAGVDVQVFSTWMDLVGYWLAPAEGRAWARLQNDTLAGAAKRNPDRFRPMATLPLQDVTASLEELDHCVNRLGMKAVEIGTSINGRNLDEEDFRPFWGKVHEYDVFVFLHPPMRSMAFERLDRYYLHNLLGNPTETTVAASRLILGGVMDAYPRLKCCLAHAGGFLPYQVGRLDRGHAAIPDAQTVAQPPSAYLRRFYYDTLAFDDHVLGHLIKMVGADRVVFGTDYPFPMTDPQTMNRLGRIGLSETEREGILGGTALKALDASGTI